MGSGQLALPSVRFSASQIAAITNGTVHGPEVDVVGATQDSRTVGPGQLFVPIVAERDGHDFVEGALRAGAGAYLTHKEPLTGTAIVVDDTLRALRALGIAARARIGGPVVGITGSVGKTSTKDLLAGALGAAMSTHASTKSFNNEIGVPLTLLNFPDAAEATVVEMGSRGLGHVAELCLIASPTVGIVTIVAGAHTGEFGSIENIAIAKGELVEALPSNGLAVLNEDNPLVRNMSTRTEARVLTFGLTPGSSMHIRSVTLDDELRGTFVIDSEWGTIHARPAARGAHMATNVAAAAGAALWLGATIEQVEEGLALAGVSPWRMEVFRSPSGALIINDSYNANPTSLRGAIESLSRLSQARKVALLGYMAELGAIEGVEHRRIADELHDADIELIAVGTTLYGVEPCGDPVETLGELDQDTALLIKGSRSEGLETIADKLR
ncbi:MAG: UDP-N-acetylmuramoyl-tripeptide--D-alanyl-D-alanine ligase [Verrucomicrobiales bacterium]|jgi:UDP-N-acetylmuramoyl-tripeptide--D-alanyl-D-alanine ligase